MKLFKLLLAAAIISLASCSDSDLMSQAEEMAEEISTDLLGSNIAMEHGTDGNTIYELLSYDYSVLDFGAVADDDIEDSDAFNDALKTVSEAATAAGRVMTLYIPKGFYLASGLTVYSNVTIAVDAGTEIRFPADFSKSTFMSIGKSSDLIENIAIIGIGGDFTISTAGLPEDSDIKMITIALVHNFLFDHIYFDDQNCTTFPMFTFSPDGNMDVEYFAPTDGIIRNCTVVNCHFGYALVQAHGGRRLHFENLYSEGGVTLRFETGSSNNDQFGGLYDITARNLYCKDGATVVMFGPHGLDSGVVQIEKVVSDGCSYAVTAGDGYYSDSESIKGIGGGSFAKGSYVRNITAIYGEHAQMKSKIYDDADYEPNFPGHMFRTIYELDLQADLDESTKSILWDAPSIGGAQNLDPNLDIEIEEDEVTLIGFCECIPRVILDNTSWHEVYCPHRQDPIE